MKVLCCLLFLILATACALSEDDQVSVDYRDMSLACSLSYKVIKYDWTTYVLNMPI